MPLRESGGAHHVLIPDGFGSIEESYSNPDPQSTKTVIYIQDAHDSLEAQENIAKIIKYLVKKEGIKTVFEEGYEGPVPTDQLFGFIKDPKIKEKVSYFLMDKLRLGGAEYAHINRYGLDFTLIGADDNQAYQKNIGWYRKNALRQAATGRDLAVLQSEINNLAGRYFPKELKEWMKIKERFEKNEIELTDYLKRLLTAWVGLKQAEQKYPHIALLVSAEHSRDEVVLEKVKTIEAKTLFEELGRLEADYANSFFQNGRDRKIFEYYQTLDLLNRLNEIRMSAAEYGVVKEQLEHVGTREFAEFIAKNSGKTVVLSRKWEQNIQNAIQFYELAHKRDSAIERTLQAYSVQRTGDRQKESLDTTRYPLDAAVLVFGGFHKEAIREILKRNGFSYFIVSPKISRINPKHQIYYKQLMAVGHHDFETPFMGRSGVHQELRMPVVQGHEGSARATRAQPIFDETYAKPEIQAIANTVSALAAVRREISSDDIQRSLSVLLPRAEARSGKENISRPGVIGKMEILDGSQKIYQKIFEQNLGNNPELTWTNKEGKTVYGGIQLSRLPNLSLEDSIVTLSPKWTEYLRHPRLLFLWWIALTPLLPSLGSFGRFLFREIKINGEPVLYISEIQPSRGFRHLPDSLKKYYTDWRRALLERLAVEAHRAGYRKIYAASPESIRLFYPTKEGIFGLTEGGIVRNYVLPFRSWWKKNWIKVNVEYPYLIPGSPGSRELVLRELDLNEGLMQQLNQRYPAGSAVPRSEARAAVPVPPRFIKTGPTRQAMRAEGPVQFFLRAIQIDKAKVILEDRLAIPGARVIRIEAKPRPLVSKPLRGLQILYNELAPVDHFELLLNEQEKVIAIFPVVEQKQESERLRYFDLSHLTFEIPVINAKSDPALIFESWRAAALRNQKDEALIREYKKKKNLDEYGVKKLGDDHIRTRYAFNFAQLEPKTGEMKISSFNLSQLLVEGNRDNALKLFRYEEGLEKIIIPTFPTVYPPMLGEDKGYFFSLAAFIEGLKLKSGDALFVGGVGSGIDSWVLFSLLENSGKKGIRIYGYDLNPLAIASTRFVLSQGGYRMKGLKSHDNFVDEKGKLVFPGIIFKGGISNTPDEPFFAGLLGQRIPLSEYWDFVPVIDRLAKGFSLGLVSGGAALIWARSSYEQIFEHYGLKVKVIPFADSPVSWPTVFRIQKPLDRGVGNRSEARSGGIFSRSGKTFTRLLDDGMEGLIPVAVRYLDLFARLAQDGGVRLEEEFGSREIGLRVLEEKRVLFNPGGMHEKLILGLNYEIPGLQLNMDVQEDEHPVVIEWDATIQNVAAIYIALDKTENEYAKFEMLVQKPRRSLAPLNAGSEIFDFQGEQTLFLTSAFLKNLPLKDIVLRASIARLPDPGRSEARGPRALQSSASAEGRSEARTDADASVQPKHFRTGHSEARTDVDASVQPKHFRTGHSEARSDEEGELAKVGDVVAGKETSYELEKKLKKNVFLARDFKNLRPVVLKIFGNFLDSEDDENKERELRILQYPFKAANPFMPGFYESGEDSGRRYTWVALEYIEGQTLLEWSRGKTPGQILDIFQELLEAVRIFHAHRLVHHDLKPDNIRVTPEGRVRLIDFGSVVNAGSDPAMLTGPYAAPEGLDAAKASFAYDVYSLGVTLAELITGDRKILYQGIKETFKNLILFHANSSMPDAGKIAPQLPAAWEPWKNDVAEVIARAVSHNPKARYQNAKEMAQAIARFRLDPDERRLAIAIVKSLEGHAEEALDILRGPEEIEITQEIASAYLEARQAYKKGKEEGLSKERLLQIPFFLARARLAAALKNTPDFERYFEATSRSAMNRLAGPEAEQVLRLRSELRTAPWPGARHFLEVLGLLDPEKREDFKDGQFSFLKNLKLQDAGETAQIYRLIVPRTMWNEIYPETKKPKGLAILPHELGFTEKFDLLYRNGRLIGIFPVFDSGMRSFNRQKFNLSSLYSEVPQPGEPGAAEKWIVFAREWRKDQAAVSRYLGTSTFLDSLPKEFSLIQFENQDGKRRVKTRVFSPWDLERNPEFLRQISDFAPEGTSFVLPVLPTVYIPGEHQNSDESYYSDLYSNANRLYADVAPDILKNFKTRVVGPGSGINLLIIWFLTRQPVLYASGINPFEVANARFLGEILKRAGHDVQFLVRLQDNLDGPIAPAAPVFPEQFDLVEWNRPYTDLQGSSAAQTHYSDLHDPDYGGVSLARFARELAVALNHDNPLARGITWDIPNWEVVEKKKEDGVVRAYEKEGLIVEQASGAMGAGNYGFYMIRGRSELRQGAKDVAVPAYGSRGRSEARSARELQSSASAEGRSEVRSETTEKVKWFRKIVKEKELASPGTLYYPGIGKDIDSVVKGFRPGKIVGVDPVYQDKKFVRIETGGKTLTLKPVKIAVTLTDGSSLEASKFELKAGKTQVVLYGGNAQILSPEVLPETREGYDVFYSAGFPFDAGTYQKALQTLRAGGLSIVHILPAGLAAGAYRPFEETAENTPESKSILASPASWRELYVAFEKAKEQTKRAPALPLPSVQDFFFRHFEAPGADSAYERLLYVASNALDPDIQSRAEKAVLEYIRKDLSLLNPVLEILAADDKPSRLLVLSRIALEGLRLHPKEKFPEVFERLLARANSDWGNSLGSEELQNNLFQALHLIRLRSEARVPRGLQSSASAEGRLALSPEAPMKAVPNQGIRGRSEVRMEKTEKIVLGRNKNSGRYSVEIGRFWQPPADNGKSWKDDHPRILIQTRLDASGVLTLLGQPALANFGKAYGRESVDVYFEWSALSSRYVVTAFKFRNEGKRIPFNTVWVPDENGKYQLLESFRDSSPLHRGQIWQEAHPRIRIHTGLTSNGGLSLLGQNILATFGQAKPYEPVAVDLEWSELSRKYVVTAVKLEKTKDLILFKTVWVLNEKGTRQLLESFNDYSPRDQGKSWKEAYPEISIKTWLDSNGFLNLLGQRGQANFGKSHAGKSLDVHLEWSALSARYVTTAVTFEKTNDVVPFKTVWVRDEERGYQLLDSFYSGSSPSLSESWKEKHPKIWIQTRLGSKGGLSLLGQPNVSQFGESYAGEPVFVYLEWSGIQKEYLAYRVDFKAKEKTVFLHLVGKDASGGLPVQGVDHSMLKQTFFGGIQAISYLPRLSRISQGDRAWMSLARSANSDLFFEMFSKKPYRFESVKPEDPVYGVYEWKDGSPRLLGIWVKDHLISPDRIQDFALKLTPRDMELSEKLQAKAMELWQNEDYRQTALVAGFEGIAEGVHDFETLIDKMKQAVTNEYFSERRQPRQSKGLENLAGSTKPEDSGESPSRSEARVPRELQSSASAEGRSEARQVPRLVAVDGSLETSRSEARRLDPEEVHAELRKDSNYAWLLDQISREGNADLSQRENLLWQRFVKFVKEAVSTLEYRKRYQTPGADKIYSDRLWVETRQMVQRHERDGALESLARQLLPQLREEQPVGLRVTYGPVKPPAMQKGVIEISIKMVIKGKEHKLVYLVPSRFENIPDEKFMERMLRILFPYVRQDSRILYGGSHQGQIPFLLSLMAGEGAEITGVEKDEPDVVLARQIQNFLGIRNVKFVVQDLNNFEPTGLYDIIAMNPPLLPVPAGWENRFISSGLKFNSGGPDGRAVLDIILKRFPHWLDSNGVLVYGDLNILDQQKNNDLLKQAGLEAPHVGNRQVISAGEKTGFTFNIGLRHREDTTAYWKALEGLAGRQISGIEHSLMVARKTPVRSEVREAEISAGVGAGATGLRAKNKEVKTVFVSTGALLEMSGERTEELLKMASINRGEVRVLVYGKDDRLQASEDPAIRALLKIKEIRREMSFDAAVKKYGVRGTSLVLTGNSGIRPGDLSPDSALGRNMKYFLLREQPGEISAAFLHLTHGVRQGIREKQGVLFALPEFAASLYEKLQASFVVAYSA